jgi:uncharacterized integral membrane protein
LLLRVTWRSGYDQRRMSAPLEHESGTAQRPAAAKRSRAGVARSSTLVVLAVLITLFAAFNLDEVKVHWIVGSGRAPLIIVIVISLLVGGVLAYFGERRTRKRR